MIKSADTLKRKFEFSKREFIDYLNTKKLTKIPNNTNKTPFANTKKAPISFKTFKSTMAKDFGILLSDYLDSLANSESLLDKKKVATILQDKANAEKNVSKSESVASSNFNQLTKIWESKNNLIGNGNTRFAKAMEDHITFRFDEFDADDFYENYKGTEADKSQLFDALKYYIIEKEQIRSKIIQLQIENNKKSKQASFLNLNTSKNDSSQNNSQVTKSVIKKNGPPMNPAQKLDKKKSIEDSKSEKNKNSNKAIVFDTDYHNNHKRSGKNSLTDTEKLPIKETDDEIEFFKALADDKDNKLNYIVNKLNSLHIDVYEILNELQKNTPKTIF